jgi:hypothetical protein
MILEHTGPPVLPTVAGKYSFTIFSVSEPFVVSNKIQR